MNRQSSRSTVRRKRRIGPEVMVSVGSVLVVVIIWTVLTNTIVASLFFPSPASTISVFGRLRPVLPIYVLSTVYRVVLGMLPGTMLGILCGVLMSWNKWINSALDPIIEGFRPIPAVALIPFFILWFGIGDLGKLILTAIGGFTVMVVTTSEAIKNVPPVFVMAARNLGAGKAALYQTVVLPAITPTLIGGVRVTIALSWALVVASEFMGAQTGLGYLIMAARRTLQTDAILVGIIIIGVLSWMMDRLVRILGDLLTRWAPR